MAKLFILLALTATTPALAEFGTKTELKSLTKELSKVHFPRRLEGFPRHLQSEAEIKACQSKCSGFEDGKKDMDALGDDPGADKVIDTMCPHVDTMKCMVDAGECAFAGETVSALICVCDCKEVGPLLEAISEGEKGDAKAAADKACKNLDGALSCVKKTDSCAMLKPMVAPLEKGNLAKTMCMMHNEGCATDEEGDYPKDCPNKEMDECNSKAIAGGDVEASCCAHISKTQDCLGGKKCMDLVLAMAVAGDDSGAVGKIVDKWVAACPDDLGSPADVAKEIEDAPASGSSSSGGDSASDDAMPRAGSNSFVVLLLGAVAALFLLR